MSDMQTRLHWDTLALTEQGAVSAVFSEPNMEEHTMADVAYIAEALRVSGRLVEIGCGVGRLTNLMAEVTESSILGIDVSGKMVGWARQWRRTNDVDFVVGTANVLRSLAAQRERVDGIYSMLVFQHIPDSEMFEYIQAAADLLRPGGALVFQYVTGEYAVDFDHRRPANRVLSWVTAAGLDCTMAGDSRHPEWQWVRAGK